MNLKKSLSVTIIATIVFAFSIVPIINTNYCSESSATDDSETITSSIISNEFLLKFTPIVLTSKEMSSLDSSKKQQIVDDIKNGNPLIVSGNPYAIQSLDFSVILNPNAQYSVVYCDPFSKITYCFGGNSIDEATNWIGNLQNSISNVKRSSEYSESDYNNVLIYEESEYFSEERAKMNVQAIYSKLGESNGRTFYSVEYLVESFVYDDEWHTSKITVRSDISANNVFQQLHDYGPLSTLLDTQVTQSASVSLSIPSGLGIEYSTSWTYTIPQMSIQDNCDIDEDFFEIVHDVVDNNTMPKVTVKPGSVVSVSSSSMYSVDDVFVVSYYKPYYKHLWPWDPHMEHNTFTITCAVLINPSA